MAALLLSRLLPFVFAVSIGTLLYISWSDITNSLSVSMLPLAAVQLWDAPTSPAPTTENTTTTESPDLTPIPIIHWKDYKKLPEWDFDDQYKTDGTAKSTEKCDGSLWNIIKQDPEMKEKFIPNIRMYVYNGSLSMREWNRLSHFNNPFGFMNYSHKDVVPVLNLVPKPKTPMLPPKHGRDCVTCAVVGAGGVLWKSGKGREIDSHDYVFRVNGAVIGGFEEDVGSRTDVYVHTSFSIKTSAYALKKYNYTRAPHDKGIKYVMIPEGMRDFLWLDGLFRNRTETSRPRFRPWTYYSDEFIETDFYVLHMDFLRYIRNRFLKSPNLNGKYWAIGRPTNGAFMVFLALHLCDRVSSTSITNHNEK